VGVRLARRIVAALWRVACAVAWSLLGLWTALALFYNVPLPPWAATVLALAVAFLYASAFRERLFVRGRRGNPWRETRRSLAALAVTAAVAIWYFGFIKPNPNEDWITKHARMPHVEVVGDKIYVKDVRNYTWRTPTDFTPGYEDRVYDVSALSSMYFVLSPIFDLEPVAHVWVCFGFADGQHVAVSVEARGVNGRPFGLFPSMFRQFQLIYVIGDERDVVGLRGVARKAAVRFYPARTTPDRMCGVLRRCFGCESQARDRDARSAIVRALGCPLLEPCADSELLPDASEKPDRVNRAMNQSSRSGVETPLLLRAGRVGTRGVEGCGSYRRNSEPVAAAASPAVCFVPVPPLF